MYILAALLFIILYCGAFLYEFREANARELRRTIQTETQKRRDVGGKSAPDSHGPMVRALKEMEFELQAAVGSDDEEPNPIHLNRLPSNTSYGADTSSFDGTSTSTNKSNMYDSFDIKFDKISFVLKDGKVVRAWTIRNLLVPPTITHCRLRPDSIPHISHTTHLPFADDHEERRRRVPVGAHVCYHGSFWRGQDDHHQPHHGQGT